MDYAQRAMDQKRVQKAELRRKKAAIVDKLNELFGCGLSADTADCGMEQFTDRLLTSLMSSLSMKRELEREKEQAWNRKHQHKLRPAEIQF